MSSDIIGKGVNRIDGRAKVTGRANYAADNYAPGLAHAVGVFSTIASGAVVGIDPTAAERSPGVVKIFHFGNFPKLKRSSNSMSKQTRVGEVRTPFEDEKIYYAGQFVALVVAETFEQARTAARLVRVNQRATPHATDLDAGIRTHGTKIKKDSPDYTRGDPEGAFASAAAQLDVTYDLPVEVHNPMEPHASLAIWKERKLDLHDSTQWVVGQRAALAEVLDLPKDAITVHAPYIGGGFGGKLFLWPHTVLAAVAARELDRPVKLVLERKNMFTTAGHRPATRQRVQLAATGEGKLLAMKHETLCQTSPVDEFLEEAGKTTRFMYNCPNVAVTHRLVPGNVGTPTSMRAPGAASGLMAMEAAMDELAAKLNVDPIELRLRNFAEKDESENRPWSGNHLRECIQTVRERFGWQRRVAGVGEMRDGEEILGWGFALANWGAERNKASARVVLLDTGGARVTCATQDIGTGTYTIVAQIASEETGLPLEKIEVLLGNTDYPEGPISGGSMATATVSPAIIEASKKAVAELLALATKRGAPLAGEAGETLSFKNGVVSSTASSRRATMEEILRAAGVSSVEGNALAVPGKERTEFTFRSFGAHAVEVRWDSGIARLRVSRVVSAFDVGRIINHKTASNQIYGSIMMGLGMALLERSVYDPHTGRVITDNLADYLVPVNADTPDMDITLLEYPDMNMGGYGARGIGEIGITGLGAAVANAVYHATGKRVRDFPITVEKLLGA